MFENTLTNEALHYMLEMAFLNKSPFTELWVGLGTYPEGEVNLKTMSQSELIASGYKRQKLTSRDWRIVKDEAVSRRVVFGNLSDEPWMPVDTAFLCTSEDDSGILLCAPKLRQIRMLLAGDELYFPFRIKFYQVKTS